MRTILMNFKILQQVLTKKNTRKQLTETLQNPKEGFPSLNNGTSLKMKKEFIQKLQASEIG